MAHHDFTPTTYYNTMGTHPPALHIEPGDSVSTTAVDARGFDHENVERAGRPNPQTGPFHVNGAEAGDTLVLKLDEVVPNRRMGWTTGRLAPNVLDFGYEANFSDEVELAYWDVDVEAGTVTLTEPQNRLTGQPLPLRPMLGTVGVAPDIGEAISTMTSAAHGGNMDYIGIKPGVTVYLPVFADGALFFLGDGHALQGDGEMDGTGVEISMDVRFSLDLIKGKTIGWPRAEDDTYLMACGNHRPLDQAVQHATTEMVSWLETDYGLTTREAHMLLGRFVEYDVGNMFDPAYTMVCKVKKAVLAELGFTRSGARVDESAHEQVLAAARHLCRVSGSFTFAASEIVEALPHLNEDTVRTHVISRCCVNAPAHHGTRYPYFRRVRRGVYQLEPQFRE